MIDSTIDAPTFAALLESTDADFVAELVDTYCQETPLLIDTLRRALEQGDTAAFTRAAHSIKSSSAALGALTFAAQARALEMTGKSGNLAGSEQSVAELVDGYSQVERALRGLRATALEQRGQ